MAKSTHNKWQLFLIPAFIALSLVILSLFFFSTSKTPSKPEFTNKYGHDILTVKGVIRPLANPVPDVNYFYEIQFTQDFYDYSSLTGTEIRIDQMVVVPYQPDVSQGLAKNLGSEVLLTGYIEFGLAESRHFKALSLSAPN